MEAERDILQRESREGTRQRPVRLQLCPLPLERAVVHWYRGLLRERGIELGQKAGCDRREKVIGRPAGGFRSRYPHQLQVRDRSLARAQRWLDIVDVEYPGV